MTGYEITKCLPETKTLNGFYDLKYILKGKRGARYQIVDPYGDGRFQIINSKGNFCSIHGNSFLTDKNGPLSYYSSY